MILTHIEGVVHSNGMQALVPSEANVGPLSDKAQSPVGQNLKGAYELESLQLPATYKDECGRRAELFCLTLRLTLLAPPAPSPFIKETF